MKIFSIIKCISYTILAITIFILKEVAIVDLRVLIGPIMAVYGICEIIVMIIERKKMYLESDFYVGFIEIFLGVTILLINLSYEMVCAIWATWSILRESFEIKGNVKRMLEKKPPVINFLESIIVMVLSVTLLLNPNEEHALMHTYLLCVELIIAGFTPVLDVIIEYHREKVQVKAND